MGAVGRNYRAQTSYGEGKLTSKRSAHQFSVQIKNVVVGHAGNVIADHAGLRLVFHLALVSG